LTDPRKNDKKLKSLKVEADAYRKLKHHHLVKMIKYRSSANELRRDGSKVPIAYEVLELVKERNLNYWIA